MLNNEFRFEGRALTDIVRYKNDNGFEFYAFTIEVEKNGSNVEEYEIRAYVNSKTINPDLDIKGRQVIVGGYHGSYKNKDGGYFYTFNATELIAIAGADVIHSNANNPRVNSTNNNSKTIGSYEVKEVKEIKTSQSPAQQTQGFEISEIDLPF